MVEDLKIDNLWVKQVYNYCIETSRKAIRRAGPAHQRFSQPMVHVHFDIVRKIPIEHYAIQHKVVIQLDNEEIEQRILAAVFRGLHAS